MRRIGMMLVVLVFVVFILGTARFGQAFAQSNAEELSPVAGSEWHSRGLESRYLGLLFVSEDTVKYCVGSRDNCHSCSYEYTEQGVVILRKDGQYFGLFQRKGDRLVGRFHPAADGEVVFFPESEEIG